jgi:UDP-N-acetylmuramoyl-L-alanyl-D-glutamate--2,6-diaminopimelate ligase
LNAILEEAGHKTALSNTIRFKVGDDSRRNLFKMSMPGRFAMQKLIREAVEAKCEYLIVEITSQGALMFRHRFIELDTLIFTNISPEHIEAHGSYENYLDSKLSIARNMSRSSKPVKTIIANADDKESWRFLECDADRKIAYGIKNAEPYKIKDSGLEFTYDGKLIHSPLSGLFNAYNILAAITCAKNEGVSTGVIASAVSKFAEIPGRVEKIDAGQDFEVIVDYAHTPDSLEKLYKIFRPDPNAPRANGKRLIGVLGGTGGGRDAWKRKEMGRLADLYCDEVILTDEDPYDEDPRKIVDDVAEGVVTKKPTIIMDRREAIRVAIEGARKGDVVLVTGKGTDPYIMGPRGTKTPWSDAGIAREELTNL